MSKILLTGASGFVGRHVLRSLQARDRPVRLVTRKPSGGAGKGVEEIHSDDLFAEPAARLRQLCEQVDTVLHLAWYAEPGEYQFSGKNLDCLQGTLALAAAARDSGVRRFVGVGTCFEYDLGQSPLLTTTRLDPQSPYAAAKAAAYLALSQALPAVGMSFAWCRLFYLYGEGEDIRRLAAALHDKLARGDPVDLTSGTQMRDFMDVADAAEMIVRIALSDHEGAANVCSGRPITIREFAERIADEYGRRDLLRFGTRADNPIDPPRVVGQPTVLP